MLVLYFTVEFMIILGRCKLKQKFFDLFIDRMVSKQFEVGWVADFFGEDFAEIMKRIKGFLLQTFMDFFEDISVI